MDADDSHASHTVMEVNKTIDSTDTGQNVFSLWQASEQTCLDDSRCHKGLRTLPSWRRLYQEKATREV